METAIDRATLSRVFAIWRRWRRRKDMVEEQEVRRSSIKYMNSSRNLIGFRETIRHGGEHLSAPQPFDVATLKTTHRQLSVDDLTVGQKHLGAYLLCRNIAQPLKSQGTYTVAEDVDGTAVQVGLYNFLSPSLASECVSWAMSVGDVFIIVEPYFKITTDGKRTVRCDNPSHLVLLDDEDPFLTNVSWAMGRRCPEELLLFDLSKKSVKSLAEEGKRHFKAKQYLQAATNYRQAYKLCRLNAAGDTDNSTEEQFALLSNCSELMLRLGHYRLALRDATKACKLNRQSVKALERRSRALLGLGLVKASLEDVEKAVEMCPTSKTAAILKKGITNRLSSRSASCDISRLLEEANRLRTCPPHENFGILSPDFCGPIEVRPSPGRGRGQFATRHIPAGSLVVGEKAMGVVFDGDVERLAGENCRFSVDKDAVSGRQLGPNESELIWRLVQICSENGEVAEAVENLFGGHDSMVKKTNQWPQGWRRVDITHAEGVIKYNCFEIDTLYHAKLKDLKSPPTTKTDEVRWKQLHCGRVLCQMASLFNHSCMPNCGWFTIADFVVICANRDIDEGEELTITYTQHYQSYEERRKHCSGFNFQCTCERCQRESAVSAQLEELMATVNSFKLDGSFQLNYAKLAVSTPLLEEVIKKLKATLPPPSMCLSEALLLLAEGYVVNGEPLRAAQTIVRSIKAHCSPKVKSISPLIISDHLVLLAFQAAFLFEASGCPSDSDAWRSIGKTLALTKYCKSQEIIHYIYSGKEVFNQLGDLFL